MSIHMLRNFREKYPDPKLAFSLRVEDVAWLILKTFSQEQEGRRVGRKISVAYIESEIVGSYPGLESTVKTELEEIISEACQWLKNEGMIANDSESHNVFITRKGRKCASEIEVKTYLLTRYLSVDILHPKIRKIYADFADGEFESAIFKAFKEVEVYAHSLGMLDKSIYGKDVFEKLFHVTKVQVFPEEYAEKDLEHLRGLFRSSYSLLRNPSAHRSMGMPPEEAISIIMIANHCLQILDKFSALSQQEQKAA